MGLLAAAVAVDAGAQSILCSVTDVPTAVSSGVADADALFFERWMLSVETGDAGPWRQVPARCGAFVRAYMEGERYASDCAAVAAKSLAFASQALASGDGGAKPAWVFDVDETLLSNAPWYAANGWELEELDDATFDAWADVAKAPALLSSLKLYNELQGLGFHIILLTGRTESQRNATEENLLFAGYQSWEKLIMRQPSDMGKTAVQYKSEKRAVLEAEGFKLLGNSGDQWSDLIGLPVSTRSFKLMSPDFIGNSGEYCYSCLTTFLTFLRPQAARYHVLRSESCATRTGNLVAHKLATEGYMDKFTQTWFSEAPNCIKSVLSADVE